MRKKYNTYSVEDFSRDVHFIEWVRNGARAREWENFLVENPEKKEDIRTAREIVESLRASEKLLPEDELYSVWKKIELFHSLHHPASKKLNFRIFLRYAAVFAFALMIGATATYYYFKNNQNFADFNLSQSNTGDTKLILSDGEEVLLKQKETDLQFNAGGDQIKINKDSVIHRQSEGGGNAFAQVVVPYGRISNVTLSDGTKVWLNAGSHLVFPQKFEGNKRQVFLTGEAYFDVVKDRNKPFVVNTKEIHVTVLGTKFNLRDHASDDQLEVVLVEGKVCLKENDKLGLFAEETTLNPAQRAVFTKKDGKIDVESGINSQYYTSWKDGILSFNRESILNVFNRLARYYNVRFVTESGVGLHRKISGKLDLKESLEDVMKVVSDAAPVSYRIENDKVYVTGKIMYLPMH
ncbi:MAG: FecR domain-containing protein [Prolixibacteraceae bacterium]